MSDDDREVVSTDRARRHAGRRRLRSHLPAVVVAWLALCVPAAAQSECSITFYWDPSPSTDVIGYVLSRGASSQVYTTETTLGNVTTYQAIVPANTQWYFSVRAFNGAGLRSGYSNEVAAMCTPDTPDVRVPLRVQFITGTIMRGTQE